MGAPTDIEACACGGAVRTGRFDLALGSEDERLYFGIAGRLCLDCGSIAFDRDTRLVLGIELETPKFVIESDSALGGI